MFNEYLVDKLNEHHNTLAKSSDDKEIFRSQGALRVLQELLNLKRDLKAHVDGLEKQEEQKKKMAGGQS